MTAKKLRGFTKICDSCSRWIWMQEISYRRWKAFENFDRTVPHSHIFSKDDIQ